MEKHINIVKAVAGGMVGAFLGMLLFMVLSSYMIYFIWFMVGGVFGVFGVLCFAYFRMKPPRRAE